jgi:hypothetical protein
MTELDAPQVTVDHLWRCPKDGVLYSVPDVCHRHCWYVVPNNAHQPVTRTTTVLLTLGHEGQPS